VENAMQMTDLFFLIPVAVVLALVIAALGAWMWLRTSGRYDDPAVADDESSDEGSPISKAEAARSTSWLI
jgi:cbb3-type cytochrome oxidase maturation protein